MVVSVCDGGLGSIWYAYVDSKFDTALIDLDAQIIASLV